MDRVAKTSTSATPGALGNESGSPSLVRFNGAMRNELRMVGRQCKTVAPRCISGQGRTRNRGKILSAMDWNGLECRLRVPGKGHVGQGRIEISGPSMAPMGD